MIAFEGAPYRGWGVAGKDRIATSAPENLWVAAQIYSNDAGMNTAPPRHPKFLVVCLGNICRSPLAEAALRSVAEREGVAAEVDSVGTAAYHVGDPPDSRSIATAAAHGIDITNFQGRQITEADYREFTHIFALDSNNLADIRGRAPHDATAEMSLLMDAVSGREGESIADPYYGDEAGFAVTWAEVHLAAEAIIDRLKPKG